MKDLIKCYCSHTTTCDCGTEEPKQEDMITKIMQMDAKMAYDSLPKQETTLEDKFKSLVSKWQEQQVHYEILAEQYVDDQHNNRKFTYKAMATRDCWKELLKIIENEK